MSVYFDVKFIRLWMTDGPETHQIGIRELYIREYEGGPDLTSGGTATASSSYNTPANAFDGNTTYWLSLGSEDFPHWLQYEFAEPVDIGAYGIYIESSLGPRDWKLQISDDGVAWKNIDVQSDINWAWRETKNFIIYPSPAVTLWHRGRYDLGTFARRQNGQPGPLNLGRLQRHGYDLGEHAVRQSSQPYPLQQATGLAAPWWMQVGRWLTAPHTIHMIVPHTAPFGLRGVAQWAQPWGLRTTWGLAQPWPIVLSRQLDGPWAGRMGRGVRQPIHGTVQRGHGQPWAVRRVLAGQVRQSYGAATPAAADLTARWGVLAHNPLRRWHGQGWLLQGAGRTVSPRAALTWAGESLALAACDLGLQEGAVHWRGTALLAEAGQWQRVPVEAQLTLDLEGTLFTLLVVDKGCLREQGAAPRFTLTLASPTVALEPPRGALVSARWQGQVAARATAQWLLGRDADWSLLDWTFPGERLLVEGRAPLAAVAEIAAAAGGVVESLPDGTPRVRHAFPHPVPHWENAPAAQVFTDQEDNLAITLEGAEPLPVDEVVVAEGSPAGAPLSVAVDTREEGLNRGRSRFGPGETLYLLVHTGPGVAVASLSASAGSLYRVGDQFYQEAWPVVFDAQGDARLPGVVESVAGITWAGDDPGPVALLADGATLRLASPALAAGRVTVNRRAQGWALTLPADLLPTGTEEASLPVQVQVTGRLEGAGAGRQLTCRRGRGGRAAGPVVEPLAWGVAAKRERGRRELDAGAGLRPVTLTALLRGSVLPGQLVEVQDAWHGRTFRGQVTGVQHRVTPGRGETRLRLLARV